MSGNDTYTPKSLAQILTRTLVGVEAITIIVEVHLANGLPAFSTVGLPETAVREAKDRVRSAILNSGFEFPAKRITVNLSPADLPKSGSGFDLPIAIGILLASGQLSGAKLSGTEMVGELGLDGMLRSVTGVLPMSCAATKVGHQLVVPAGNAAEAALLQDAGILAASNLLDVCAHLLGQQQLQLPDQTSNERLAVYPDLADVKGQQQARRALEIAASGGHSLLMVGPPGTGKSMLASRLPGIMPLLSNQDALALACVQSVANGRIDVKRWRQRPLRQPHHSASAAALVGGGCREYF